MSDFTFHNKQLTNVDDKSPTTTKKHNSRYWRKWEHWYKKAVHWKRAQWTRNWQSQNACLTGLQLRRFQIRQVMYLVCPSTVVTIQIFIMAAYPGAGLSLNHLLSPRSRLHDSLHLANKHVCKPLHTETLHRWYPQVRTRGKKCVFYLTHRRYASFDSEADDRQVLSLAFVVWIFFSPKRVKFHLQFNIYGSEVLLWT